MRRTADGTFEPVDWDTAIREVAAGLAKIRDTHGGDKIFYYGGGGQGNHLPGAYGRDTRAALGMAPGFFAIRAGSTDEPLVSLLEEALEKLPPDALGLRARVLGRMAIALYWSTSQERRRVLGEQAIELAERAGDPATLAFALAARHAARWSADNLH